MSDKQNCIGQKEENDHSWQPAHRAVISSSAIDGGHVLLAASEFETQADTHAAEKHFALLHRDLSA